MKNIHILPTDKPSRLFYNVGGALLFTKWDNYNGVHIYITSDEEIKEGDWYISILENEVYKATKETQNIMSVANLIGTTTYKNTHFKIILTTDQDLIKDGVQAIDYEFLEWFVKNPSCEEVDWFYSSLMKDYEYEIIIPKEEPKQTDEKGNLLTYWGGLEEPNIIDDWLEKNGDPKIAKQVEQEAKELCEKLTPMNDLLEDLKETKISVKESIDIIEDEFIRTQINIFVQKT